LARIAFFQLRQTNESNLLLCIFPDPLYNPLYRDRKGDLKLLFLLLGLVALNGIVLGLVLRLQKRFNDDPLATALKQVTFSSEALQNLSYQFSTATADMAQRLERTKGELHQGVADRLVDGFSEIRTAVETQLQTGRREQAERLSEARRELTASLALTTSQLKSEFDNLNQNTVENLDSIRDRVDAKLLAISDQVQHKLDQNIREGFAQFEKVGAIGHSINDLNNLLKLPHLRGQFGEASLERLLADFLPAHMFEMQASLPQGRGRADAIIHFPDQCLPIDAKFPREQVLGLFESTDKDEIEEARGQFVRVMKAEGKRIQAYIQPEHGTTDIALMYLPSETLYMEAIRNRELADWLNHHHVFPVSPNTLLMTLKTVALVHKWYEMAGRFEKSRLELAKAQKSFDFFQNQFENVGRSLNKAQEAFDKAATHLKTYRGRVSVLSGQEQLDLEAAAGDAPSLPLADKASA
jgi:DNA recombination protein RmuC